MVRIRIIESGELEKFAACCTQPEDVADITKFIGNWIAIGATRLDWCFVVEDEDRFVGRLAWRTRPQVGIPSDIVMFDLPWEADYRAVGTQLLAKVLPLLGASGATQVGYELNLPPRAPQWQHYPEQRHDLLTAVRFLQLNEMLRFRLESSDFVRRASGRLTFRSLTESDDATFINAISRVSVGTLDHRISADIAQLGSEQAATQMFKLVQYIGFDANWWQLAYDANSELVGFVLAVGNAEWGSIGYIGVVPEKRGNGYIDDLLARGTAIMLDAGVPLIEADTDVANFPMANAFRRAGYTEFGRRRNYRWRQDK